MDPTKAREKAEILTFVLNACRHSVSTTDISTFRITKTVFLPYFDISYHKAGLKQMRSQAILKLNFYALHLHVPRANPKCTQYYEHTLTTI